jgi:hypothetical protein
MRFIDKTGYLPVTKQAFETDLAPRLETVEDVRIKKMLTAVLSMYEEYEFFTAPTFSGFDSISSGYAEDYYALMQKYRTARKNGETVSAADALAEIRQ